MRKSGRSTPGFRPGGRAAFISIGSIEIVTRLPSVRRSAYYSALFRRTRFRIAARHSPVSDLYFQAGCRSAAGNNNSIYCSLQCNNAPQQNATGGVEGKQAPVTAYARAAVPRWRPTASRASPARPTAVLCFRAVFSGTQNGVRGEGSSRESERTETPLSRVVAAYGRSRRAL